MEIIICDTVYINNALILIKHTKRNRLNENIDSSNNNILIYGIDFSVCIYTCQVIKTGYR